VLAPLLAPTLAAVEDPMAVAVAVPLLAPIPSGAAMARTVAAPLLAPTAAAVALLTPVAVAVPDVAPTPL
jgi:hypothetical protein